MPLDFLSTALTVGSSLLEYSGSKKAAKGARVAGERNRAAREAQAASIESRAGQELAVSQVGAEVERRRARLLASRTIALAAAGGGDTSDPTLASLVAGIAGEGAYRAAIRIYEGKETARGLREQAAGVRYEGFLAEEEGAIRSNAYKKSGVSALLSGATSLFTKYNAGRPVAGVSGTPSYEQKIF